MKMKTIITLLFIWAPLSLFGTAQVSEKLEYRGEVQQMFSTPLETYFTEQHPRPNEVLRSLSSANWRGYVGHWKIQDKSLILLGLYSEKHVETEDGTSEWKDELIPAEKIFGDNSSYPIPATWFTGTIKIPVGERVRYVHMGFGSQYEKEIILELEAGQIVKETETTYDPQRDAFRSQSDFEWVALAGEELPKDDFDWVDGRFLPTPIVGQFVESGETFRTRGILTLHEEISYLWIPETSKTGSEYLPMNKMIESEIGRGSHVEVVVHFYQLEDGYGIEVDSIRSLEPGETIHNPNFPEIWEDFQNWLKKQEQAPEPNDSASTDSEPVTTPEALAE